MSMNSAAWTGLLGGALKGYSQHAQAMAENDRLAERDRQTSEIQRFNIEAGLERARMEAETARAQLEAQAAEGAANRASSERVAHINAGAKDRDTPIYDTTVDDEGNKTSSFAGLLRAGQYTPRDQLIKVDVPSIPGRPQAAPSQPAPPSPSAGVATPATAAEESVETPAPKQATEAPAAPVPESIKALQGMRLPELNRLIKQLESQLGDPARDRRGRLQLTQEQQQANELLVAAKELYKTARF